MYVFGLNDSVARDKFRRFVVSKRTMCVMGLGYHTFDRPLDNLIIRIVAQIWEISIDYRGFI